MGSFNKNHIYIQFDIITDQMGGDVSIIFENPYLETFAFSSNLPGLTLNPSYTSVYTQSISLTFNKAGYSVGDYVATITAESDDNLVTAELSLKIYDSTDPKHDPNASNDPVIPADSYNLKYWLEYPDLDDNVYRLEIRQLNFAGQQKEIHGNVIHNYSSRKHLFNPIVSSNLDIQLEADENLTLQDLYSENEREYLVTFFRNSNKLFHGYLKPDGIWEDFVYDKWQITMDAMDGLSILQNLSFIKDNGTPFKGTLTQFECVFYALRRIGYELPINIDIRLFYFGYAETDSILSNVLVNADRFYQADNKNDSELMDCEAVLKSVLDLYNATIIQMNGEWFIYRTIDMKETMTFNRYIGVNYEGDITINAGLEIGSHINNYEVHHINSNQKKSITPSIQAYRLNYKYGLVKSIAENSELYITDGTLASDGWAFPNPDNKILRNPSGFGIYVKELMDYAFPLLNPASEIVHNTQIIEIEEGDYIDVKLSLHGPVPIGVMANKNQYIYTKIETDNYIFKHNEGWVAKPITINTQAQSTKIYPGFNEITYHLDAAPEDSDITITIYGIRILASDTALYFKENHYFFLDGIDVVPNQNDNLKGEFHTAQFETRISSVVKDDKVVHNGDSESDIYLGTLYQKDGSETVNWFRQGVDEELSLLRINVEDNIRVSPRPMLFFEGDLYGYFPFLKMFTIDNVPGRFQLSKYSFNTQSGITQSSFQEFENAMLDPEDFRYEFEYDYGSETKVKISN